MKKKIVRTVSVALAIVFLFGTVSAAAVEKKPRFVVLGDSIAFGLGLRNPWKAVYGKIVADTDGFDYENYAIPGHTTADLLRRIKNKKVNKAIRSADIISISIGGNNFLFENQLLILFDGIVKNDYSRVERITESFVVDLDRIVTEIRAANPNAAILLQTIYNPQTGYAGEVYGKSAAMINNAIKAYVRANSNGIYLVDVAAKLTDSTTDFAKDGVHPSAVGNEKIARAVLETLYANGLGNKKEPVISVKGKDVFGTEFIALYVEMYCTALHLLASITGPIPA